MTTTILKEALKWAKVGVPVFPCGSNKAPLTENGHLDATTDPDQVKFMFESMGDDVMIGARMGTDSKLFALDFDLYKDGAAQYMQYLSDKGLLNDTQVHTTKSGGLHIIYRSDGDYPNVKPHVGVEVKGEGGYIIVPPSAGYTVQQRGIAYANPNLVKELLNAKRAASSSTVDSLKRQVLSGTAFHDPLAQIAARRSSQGWPPERVQRELYDVLEASAARNKTHARHPRWLSLMEDGGQELSRIVGSGNDKFNPNVHTDKARDNVDDDLLKGLSAGSEGMFKRPDTDDEPNREAIPEWGTELWPFEGQGYFSTEDRDIFNQAYVAYPLFAERESVLLAAEPKAGKTAIALKLAMQVANGEDLGNDFKVTEARPVLYFTLEGARAVEMRIRAERDKRREKELSEQERDMLFVVDRPHNFADKENREANGAKIVLHNEMCKRQFNADLGLIVIDTLTKAMPGRDQNSVEDTSELFELIGFLRSNGINATILFIHHLSKQGNVRGSTNIEAEVDVVLGVRKDNKSGLVQMGVWRARSMDEETDYLFKFTSHHLGTTKQGHELHAPVVSLAEPEVDSSGATAAMAAKFAKAMDAIIALGKGEHDVQEVAISLANSGLVTPPTGKRPNFKTRTITDQLDAVFQNKTNFSYGDYIIRVRKAGNGLVESVKVMHAA